MKKGIFVIGVLLALLMLFAFVFAVTQIDAPLPPSDGSTASSGGKSVADYLKIFNANLLGDNSITQPPSTSVSSASGFLMASTILPKGESPKYHSVEVSSGKLGIPIYSESETPPFYCSRYVKYVAKDLFGECYPSTDAWELKYADKMNTHVISNGETISSLISNGILAKGRLIGVYTPLSEYNNTIDSKNSKVKYTHVVIYLGNTSSGAPRFADLYANEIRVFDDSVLLSQFTPIEVLYLNTPAGVNRGCDYDAAKVMPREEYYNKLLEYIRFEESGRNSTGLRKVASSVWEGLGLGKTYGEYQVGISSARNLFTYPEVKALFGNKNSAQVSDSEISKVLETSSGGKTVAFALLKSNEGVISSYSSISSYTCVIPPYGSLDRYFVEGTAYNAGVLAPLTAGIQYAFYKAGADYSGVSEIERFDGYIGTGTGNAIKSWATKFGISVDLGNYNSKGNFYDSALIKILNNGPLMKKLFEEYNKNTQKTCVPLFIPYDDAQKMKLTKFINYGVRIGNQASK